MFRKLLISFGIIAASVSATANPPYAPYKSDAANKIYNLIFCDNVADFLAKSAEKPTPWQLILASNPIDIPALETLASDLNQEGRIRYLAYQKLRLSGKNVPSKILLGVIIEMPLSGGLDTLAAYSEGGVRYINKSEKLVFSEDISSLRQLVDGLFTASQPVVSAIGPWKEPRRAPPNLGSIRMTFLTSDGISFGEGPLTLMQKDQMAAPVITQATELLLAVVALGTK